VDQTSSTTSAVTAAESPRRTYLAGVLDVQDVRLDPETRRVWRGGAELTLSRKEFDLLHALMRRAGDIVTRAELMAQVWETTFFTSSKTIDVHLGWLRRKLGDSAQRPTLITTHRGRGLRFEPGPAD
jgi:DNA-binding response OmpR family regulator